MSAKAVGTRRMQVGFNYPHPWNLYGIYLGSGNPPGNSPGMDVWPQHLRQNLAALREGLGVSIVRIFLLGNAANCLTVTKTRELGLPSERYSALSRGGLVSLSEQPHPKVIEQLGQMFQAFADERMQVIPSLIDFKAFGRKLSFRGSPARNNGCTNRFGIVSDPKLRDAFFEKLLRPFLAASEPFASAVYAWEVQNEPAWNFGWSSYLVPETAGGKTVSPGAMRAFLQAGIDTIESFPARRRFKATVGHRFARDLERFPTGSLRQFHFYPEGIFGGVQIDRKLPNATESRAFLGEIGSGAQHGKPWPELQGADARDTRTRVRERLSLAERKGYELSLLWPDLEAGAPFPGPDPLKLSPEAQHGIVDFQKAPRS